MKTTKGIFNDVQPNQQPEGTYRDALNVLLTESYNVVTNDRSIAETTSFGGVVLFSLNYKNKTIIFGKKSNVSEIGILEGTTYTKIINDDDIDGSFGFGENIQAIVKSNFKNELMVYWVDETNPVRYLNLDSPVNIISETLLFPTVEQIPIINTSVISGGGVKVGSHTFFLRYIDEDNTPTNYVGNSLPVYVSNVNFGGKAETNSGKSIQLQLTNLDTNYKRFEIAVVSQFNGVITETNLLPVRNFNTTSATFSFTGNESFRIETLENIQIDNAYYVNAKAITSQDDTLYLGNLTKEEEFNYQPYANNIQVELVTNTLTDAAVFENSNDNQIIYDLIKETDKGFQNPNNKKFSGFKSGEVYALYLAWVLKNGQETKAFHIPGRKNEAGENLTTVEIADVTELPLSTTSDNSIVVNTADFGAEGIAGTWTVQFQGSPTSTEGAISDVDTYETMAITLRDMVNNHLNNVTAVLNNPTTVAFSLTNATTVNQNLSITRNPSLGTQTVAMVGELNSFGLKFGLASVNEQSVETWRYSGSTKTQILTRLSNEINNITGYSSYLQNEKLVISHSSEDTVLVESLNNDYGDAYTISSTQSDIINGMGFWENQNEEYPNTDSFLVLDVDGNQIDDFRNEKVRHHLFAEHNVQPYYHLKENSVDFITKGIKLTNVVLPADLADKVVGYKVYYAKRTEENKRIIDQSAYAASSKDGNQFVGSSSLTRTAEFDAKIIYTYPFGALNNSYDLAQVTHLKSIQKFYFNRYIFFKGGTRLSQNINEAPKLYNVLGKAKVPSADGPTTTSLNPFNININFNNDSSPTTVVFRVNEDIDLPVLQNIIFELISSKTDVYNSFDNQILVDTGYTHTNLGNLNSDNIFGGDTFVNSYTFKTNIRTSNTNFNSLYSIIVETSFNISKRQVGDSFKEVFYPAVAPRQASAMYFGEDGNPETVDETRSVTAFDNYISYAEDASQVNNLRGVFPKSKFEQSTDVYNTRVIRSSTFENTDENSYRLFLQDDFIDLPKTRGNLIKLVVMNNTLMPHCERGIWITKGREELEVGDIRAFIGSGNIFATKPNEITSTPDGMLGIEKPQDSMLTPFGYYVVDKFTKKVFLINAEGLMECSANGMYNYFQNADLTNVELGYDPRYKRIFTKFGNTPIVLSYSPELKTFISRHEWSIIPTKFITTENKIIFVNNNFFTYSNGNLTMYIKVVDNEAPDINKILQSLSFQTEVYDSDNQVKKTFNKYTLSNSYQTTGEVTIDISNNYDYINDNARRVSGIWNINKIRTTAQLGRQRLKDKYVIIELSYTETDKIYLHDLKANFKLQER